MQKCLQIYMKLCKIYKMKFWKTAKKRINWRPLWCSNKIKKIIVQRIIMIIFTYKLKMKIIMIMKIIIFKNNNSSKAVFKIQLNFQQ